MKRHLRITISGLIPLDDEEDYAVATNPEDPDDAFEGTFDEFLQECIDYIIQRAIEDWPAFDTPDVKWEIVQ